MTSVADLIGADGAAGQPQLLERTARSLDQAGSEVARLRTSLRAVEAAQWHGQARVRFDKLRDSTVDADLAPIDPGYDAGVAALRRYARELAEIQDRARQLARTITDTEHRLGDHRRDESIADGAVVAAKTAALVTTLTPTARIAAEYALKEARAHRERMRSQTVATERRLQRHRTEGAELRAQLDQAAQRCAAALDASRPPAAPKHLTPLERDAAAIAAVAAGVAAIRRIGPGKGESADAARDRARENAMRKAWNATPGRPSGPLKITNARIAELARERAAAGGWGGQCLWWVHQILNADGTIITGFGDNTATYQASWSKVAIEVPSIADAIPGDIVQWQSPDGRSVHTMIITDSGPPVRIADSNSRPKAAPEQLALGDLSSRISGKEGWVKIWRVGQV